MIYDSDESRFMFGEMLTMPIKQKFDFVASSVGENSTFIHDLGFNCSFRNEAKNLVNATHSFRSFIRFLNERN